MSETLGKGYKLRVAAAALRSVEHRGGLDAFLLKASDATLSTGALSIKSRHRQEAGRDGRYGAGGVSFSRFRLKARGATRALFAVLRAGVLCYGLQNRRKLWTLL